MLMVSRNFSKLAVGGLAVSLLGLLGPVAARTAAPMVRKAFEGPAPHARGSAVANYGKLPLRFEANIGQVASEAKFLARAKGGTVFLTNDEAVLSIGSKDQLSDDAMGPAAPSRAVVRMRTIGANPLSAPEGFEVLPGITNYLTGSDPAGWRTGVTSYAGVRYREVYPGIDQVFHGKNSALEYDFEVAAGADPSRIGMSFDGANATRIDSATGDLVLATAVGEVRQAKPTLYQDIDGARRPVSGGFALAGARVGFTVGDYDRHLPLVIDPVIAYSALFGGTGDEEVAGVAVDASGAAYVSGTTFSPDFPTQAAYQPTGTDGMFVTKLTADGSSLVYSTYLGQGAQAAGIAVDSTGAAYVAGSTAAPDFPMVGSSFDPSCGADGACRGDAAFQDGLTTAGSDTLASSSANFLAADVGKTINGANIPAGTTITVVVNSKTVTLSNPASTTGVASFTLVSRDPPTIDTVVAKLTSEGSALAYSTYLGGSSDDVAAGISVDSLGHAYVTGTTRSFDFPTTSGSVSGTTAGYDRFCGTGVDTTTGLADGTCNSNVTFTGASSTAGSPVYSTITNFDNRDVGRPIVGSNIPSGTYITTVVRHPNRTATLTLSNNATDTGTGLSYTLIGKNRQSPPEDVFLSKINTNADTGPASVAYSTYLGGGSSDTAAGVAADPNESQGGVYIVGSARGLGFPTTATAFQPGCDRQLDPQAPCTFGANAFVVKLTTNQGGAASLSGRGGFGTYLGSPGNTNARAVAADFFGVYVTGETDAPGFPTKNAFQSQLRQTPSAPTSQDAFVSKLVSDGTNLVYSTFLGGTDGDHAQGIAVDAAGAAFVTGGTSSSDFPTKDSIQGPAPGFTTKLAPSGSTLDFSTYLGVFGDVAVNPAGDSAVYVAGGVQSVDFPAVSGSLRSGPRGGNDAAVVKLVPGVTPVINQLTPRGGPTSGGTPVVLTGEGFLGATGVSFGGTAALSFTVDSPTQITAIAPPRAGVTIADLTVFVTVTGAQGTSLGLGLTRYVYGEGVFHPTGSCVENRCPTGGQAVNLLDGRVLYTNGAGARFGNHTLPASSQLYNPASGTWSATGACTGCGFGEFGRTFTITTLPNGKVLVAGGLSSPSFEPTAAAFLYDPVAGSWSPTGSMTTVRHGHTATLLGNGKVLVAGGCTIGDCSTAELPPLATSELYDPATGLWTRTPGDMSAGRSEHTASLLDPAGGACGSVCGKVLVAFGSGASFGDVLKPGLASAELFDPATGTWTATGSSSGSGRTRHSAVRLLDGRVMISGGYDSDAPFPPETNATELYNPVTETWSIRGILTAGHGLQPSLVRLPNGKVLIVGGQTDIAEIWDPADGRWRSATSSAFLPRLNPAAALLVSGPASACGTSCGKVLVAGGTSDLNIGTSNPPLAVAELYTPRPAVASVTPASMTAGSAVTITGTGLTTVSSVMFGTLATSAITHDAANPDGVLTVVVPTGATSAPGVTVTSPGGVSPLFVAPVPAPVNVTAIATGGGTARVTWGAPASGALPSSYTVTPSAGSGSAPATVSSTTRTASFSGLTGSAVRFTVTATGAAGTSGPAVSNAVDAAASTPVRDLVTDRQYQLAGSNGTTWVDLDPVNLAATYAPPVAGQLVLDANIDLWTADAGVNQDVAVVVSGGAFGAGTVVGWKESGGFAGTFSPNAAAINTAADVEAGVTYTVKLAWKANVAAAGKTIFAGAGPIGGGFSPTRLTATFTPSSNAVAVTKRADQFVLAGSDGATWSPMTTTTAGATVDPVTRPFTAAADGVAAITGNADLWTWNTGYNQDVALKVSGGAYGDGQIVAWKESGGFAGTFSPNAALVEARVPVTNGVAYTAELVWRANKPMPAGVKISAAAGNPGSFSPTTLTVAQQSTAATAAKASAVQYRLDGSDGSTWQNLNTPLGDQQPFDVTYTAPADGYVHLVGNSDLWTYATGYNQDIGIKVTAPGGDPGTAPGGIVAWKESGGFAGTFSPNAAAVEGFYPVMAGHTYTFTLVWKTNKPAATEVSISAGAGNPGDHSPTRLDLTFRPT